MTDDDPVQKPEEDRGLRVIKVIQTVLIVLFAPVSWVIAIGYYVLWGMIALGVLIVVLKIILFILNPT